jgi:hypothetical protein
VRLLTQPRDHGVEVHQLAGSFARLGRFKLFEQFGIAILHHRELDHGALGQVSGGFQDEPTGSYDCL